MNRNGFRKQHQLNKTRTAAAILAAAMLISGCGSAEQNPVELSLEYEPGTLVIATGEENGLVHTAGSTVASIINKRVPGIHVDVELSKGSMINAVNVSEEDVDLAIVSGDVAYDAVKGLNSFEGEPLDDLCVLAACYQEVSGWAALESSGLTHVNQLKGKILSTGSKASVTEVASEAVFAVMGINGSNSELYSDSISASVQHVKRQTADASHAFSAIPNGNHESVAAEFGVSILSYTEEELNAILAAEPRYFKTEIPEGTYTGQENPVPTFGIKVLVCASKEMDPDLAYEIARAMDLDGPLYAGGHPFMAAMLDKPFLCGDLPIPLHEGAEAYYREMGFLDDK